MTGKLTPKKLAAMLADCAKQIRSVDGDFIAQTASYGLFLAHLKPNFDCSELISHVTDKALVLSTQECLNSAHFEDIFAKSKATGRDPAIYFYEDFLRAYDPSVRTARGVIYSPPEVVDFILRGVAAILRKHFSDSKNFVLIDPCCGLGVFLNRLDLARLPASHMIGIELSAPAAELAKRLVPQYKIINRDSLQELNVRTDGSPLVIIGNPPYSGHSANAGAIAALMKDYQADLDERNPKWLQDDYVKFIRMAQHRVDKAGSGIVAFITNHSYIFSPTFRAMRTSLMHSFDQVFVVNLYGNSKMNSELTTADENIFPIQTGVAIAFFVKTKARQDCKIMHAGITGTRQEKLGQLAKLDLHNIPWQEVKPAKPFSVFIPTNPGLQREFYGFASLLDLFKERSVGFVTSRDSFAIDRNKEALIKRISELRDPSISVKNIQKTYRISDLDIRKARTGLIEDTDWESRIANITYRPFDNRWAYLSRYVMERPRLPFMENLLNDNLALAVGRAGQVTGSQTWDVAFVVDRPADLNLFRRGGAMLLPLYTYKNGKKKYNSAKVNEKFLYYIYAVLYSRSYKERYADFLKMDYPRIPLQPDDSLFTALSELGEQLVCIHLMRANLDKAKQPASMRIGGWEVPGKYLKDRQGEWLSDAESLHLGKLRAAVAATIELQDQIDAVIADKAPW